jgi:predicted permease
MTTFNAAVIRAAARLLRSVVSRDRADAVLGDLEEELADRAARGRSPRFPRLWLLGHVLTAVIAAARAVAPRALRAWRHTFRDAIRGLRSASATTAFIITILAIAMSAATVTFTTVDHVVLRSLPFEDDDELVAIAGQGPLGAMAISAFEYLSWRERARAFQSIAAVRRGRKSIAIDGATHAVMAADATASLFDVLRTPPLLGRVFSLDNETAGDHRVAVIGFGLWQRYLAGRAGIVGEQLAIGKESFEVVGVMPPGFTYPVGQAEPVELWTPYVVPPDERTVDKGRSSYLHVVARRADGVTVDQSRAEIEAISSSVAAASPGVFGERRPTVTPLYDSLVGKVRGWMLLVLGAVALVLAIACVNVANLLLARSSRRAREAAIRSSLGATRRQLIAASLIESVILSTAAAAIGLVVAIWGVSGVKWALPATIARGADIALDLRVFLAAIASSLISAALFGIVPAWQASRLDIALLIKEGAAHAGGRSRWRSGFLIAEVALVVALLIGSALFVASFIRVTGADLGFSRTNLIMVSVSSTTRDEDVAAHLRGVPGVQEVAVVTMGSPPLIFAGFGGGTSTSVLRSTDDPDGPVVEPEVRRVSPEYFRTAAIPILRGRAFTPDERKAPVAIIDDLAAHQLFGTLDVIGRPLRAGPQQCTIVGVVANVRMRGPESSTGPQLYLPLDRGAAQYIVRTNGAATVGPAVRAAASELAAPGRTPEVLSIDDAFRRITADRRFNAGLMLLFGLIALIIGATGTYGVMTAVVAQQAREMAVRVTLGASRRRIVSLVVGQAGWHLGAGLVIGLAIAVAASQAFRSVLYGVTPTDPVVYAVVVAVLAAVGLAAAILPARRASQIDPISTLRQI